MYIAAHGVSIYCKAQVLVHSKETNYEQGTSWKGEIQFSFLIIRNIKVTLTFAPQLKNILLAVFCMACNFIGKCLHLHPCPKKTPRF